MDRGQKRASSNLGNGEADRPSGDFDFLKSERFGQSVESPLGWLSNDASGERKMVLAEFMPRVGAEIIDGIIIGLVATVFQVVILILAGLVPNGSSAFKVLNSAVLPLLVAAYFVFYDSSPDQGTPGKQLMGIKVTDLNGNRVSRARAVGRFLAKIISNLTFGIGYLLPLVTKRRQTLHDLIAGCLALER